MAMVLFESGQEQDDVVDVNQAGLPLQPHNDDIDGPLEHRRGVAEPMTAPLLHVKVDLSLSSSRIGICQKTQLLSTVVKTFAPPSESMHSSIRG